MRWRSHVLAGALVASTVAVTVATLSSAARSEEAFDRLRAATGAGDAVLFFEDTLRDPTGAVSAVTRVDGVVAAAAAAEVFVRPAGTDYYPDFNLYPTAPLGSGTGAVLDSPVITTGRPVAADRADEVALSEDLAADLAVTVGDTITLESMTSAWIDTAFSGGDPGPPDGPRVDVAVVGVGRTPADFGRFEGVLWLSPSFVERYEDQMRMYGGVHTRLTPDALEQAREGGLPGLDGIEMSPSPFGDIPGVDDGLGMIAVALRLVALAGAVAGAVATALALARLSRVTLRERVTLGALGWTGRDMVRATALTLAPWLIVGVGVGVIAGVFASPVAMVGLARSIDPTPRSVVVDGGVVLAAGVVALVGGLVVVVVTARRAATARRDTAARPRGGGIPLRQPVPAVLGIRHALFSAGDTGGRASQGALAALAAGVIAVVAALGVGASIARLQTDPSLSGQGGGRLIDSGESVDTYDRALPVLERDERVVDLAGIHISFDIATADGDDMPALAHDIRRGDIEPSIITGRLARQPDEVALGPATLDRLERRVGDVIELRGPHGGAAYRIVGSVLFPEGDFDHDDGAAMSTAGADRLLGDTHDAAQLHTIVFDWAERVDTAEADKRLAAAGFEVFTPDTTLKPAAVTNLGEVQTLPRYLAVFVGLLALVTLGHALSVTTRLRAREFGTLRALGATARATSVTIAVQAATLLSVALAIGLPVGIALGRQTWTAIAHRAHVVVHAVAPWASISVALAAVTIATAALTGIPAMRALRLSTAETLRAE